jgi:hypothetical protein
VNRFKARYKDIGAIGEVETLTGTRQKEREAAEAAAKSLASDT